MSDDGSFSPAARAAILGRTDGRCAGCRRTDVTLQHRVARMMGGRHQAVGSFGSRISHPANGLALCGHGTAGCHGWAERHPVYAGRFGWSLVDGTDPVGVPYWTHAGVWRPWAACDVEGLSVYVLPDEALELLDLQPPDLADAVAAFARDRRVKL